MFPWSGRWITSPATPATTTYPGATGLAGFYKQLESKLHTIGVPTDCPVGDLRLVFTFRAGYLAGNRLLPGLAGAYSHAVALGMLACFSYWAGASEGWLSSLSLVAWWGVPSVLALGRRSIGGVAGSPWQGHEAQCRRLTVWR